MMYIRNFFISAVNVWQGRVLLTVFAALIITTVIACVLMIRDIIRNRMVDDNYIPEEYEKEYVVIDDDIIPHLYWLVSGLSYQTVRTNAGVVTIVSGPMFILDDWVRANLYGSGKYWFSTEKNICNDMEGIEKFQRTHSAKGLVF